MTTTMTKRDKILLYVVLLLGFIALYIRFLLLPALEDHETALADLADAEAAQTQMEYDIALAPAAAQDVQNTYNDLLGASNNFYSVLSSDELDQILTGLELNHDLQPVSMNISAATAQSLTGYTASALSGTSAAPTAASSAADEGDDTGDDFTSPSTLLTMLAPNTEFAYDQPGYFTVARVTFSATGTQANFEALLDDLAQNYPSVQLVSFSIQDRSYLNADGESVETSSFTVSLDVYLCDREGVQS